jgi:hypothetical protein
VITNYEKTGRRFPMGSGFRSLLAIVVGGLWILAPLPAGAVITCDLSTGATTTCTINGAIYRTGDTQPAGSGIFNSFVRTGTNDPIEQGYNTSTRPLTTGNFESQINNSPTFTRDLLLTEVPIVTISGVTYYQFQLDINQTNADPLLSLDNVKIFLSNTGGNVATDNFGTGLGTQIYSLDAATDTNGILLNYTFQSGSGQADMFLDVPTSLFVGGTYVYLWSQFGSQEPNSGFCLNPPTCTNNDGFEEWSVGLGENTGPPPVPEPATMFLGGTGLVLFGYLARRRLFGGERVTAS